MNLDSQEPTEMEERVKINQALCSEIEGHLVKSSSTFNPPLDSYVNITEYSKKLKENATTIEIWEKKVLVGLLAVYLNNEEEKRGFITNVSVLPEYQGCGLGSVLLNKILEYGREANYEEIILEVRKENIKAIKIYKKFGFKEFDSTKNSVYMIYYLSDEE